jgi:tetratricopeptide (TPR) repeat protein
MLRAQSLQAAGRYREAIGAYQQALPASSGVSAGDAYQGIALSQQRLGNDGAARGAYRQAIAAYEAQVAAGRDAGAAQRGIASCRAALEVLGDG